MSDRPWVIGEHCRPCGEPKDPATVDNYVLDAHGAGVIWMSQDPEVDIGQIQEAILGLDKLCNPAFFDDRVVTPDPRITIRPDPNRLA